jgi:hypothetical protein
MIINPLNKPEFLIQLFMICTLLFIAHSVIFKYYLNDLLKETFNENINNIIDTGFKNKIKNFANNPLIKILFELFPFPEGIKTAYSQESEQTKYFNNYFIFNLFSINLILIIILFVFIYIYKVTCNANINLLNITITNIIALVIMGFIEYKFFMNISNKYKPMLSSEIADTFINKIKNDLS